MKIEIMIYVYIAICISLICFNSVYVFFVSHQQKRLTKETYEYYAKISEQIELIEKGVGVSHEHKKTLCRKLKRIINLTAFDRSMEKIYSERPQKAKEYLFDIYPVFMQLATVYRGRDTVKTAYFPYILSKYEILKHKEANFLADFIFDMLRIDNVYCRENALKALYSTGKCDYVVEALKIIDANLSFHHPKLICDGLLNYKGDKEEMKKRLFESFNEYSVDMQLNILNYFRFGNVRSDEEMLEILTSEKMNRELRFSAIRYFEKFPNTSAERIIQSFAENRENLTWEYQAIASSALKSYPGDVTFRILVENLSSSNWHIRQNSAISLEKLGYTYHDLISVFDGDDRYAREIMRYRLDKRNAESEAMKV